MCVKAAIPANILLQLKLIARSIFLAGLSVLSSSGKGGPGRMPKKRKLGIAKQNQKHPHILTMKVSPVKEASVMITKMETKQTPLPDT